MGNLNIATLDRFTIVALAGIVGMFVLMVVVRLAGSARPEAPEGRALWLGRLSMCLTMAGALALAVSGFGAPLIDETGLGMTLQSHGTRIGGWLLLGHVSFGGLFMAGLVGIAIFCADRHRFGCGPGVAAGPLRKLFFWLVLLMGIGTTLTVVISMTPLFSSQAIEQLSYYHRWSALTEVMALIGLALSR